MSGEKMYFLVNVVPSFCPGCGKSTQFNPDFAPVVRKALEKARQVHFEKFTRMTCKHCDRVEYVFASTESLLELMSNR